MGKKKGDKKATGPQWGRRMSRVEQKEKKKGSDSESANGTWPLWGENAKATTRKHRSANNVETAKISSKLESRETKKRGEQATPHLFAPKEVIWMSLRNRRPGKRSPSGPPALSPHQKRAEKTGWWSRQQQRGGVKKRKGNST